MCVNCRINGELCCGRRCTRGAWSASRCCMDLGAGETAFVPPGIEIWWIHALLCAVCHRDVYKRQIQHGSAWWFSDHKIGMEEQMTRLASLGLLGNFVGMLTDSRSFLSYTRHDYFRRIL